MSALGTLLSLIPILVPSVAARRGGGGGGGGGGSSPEITIHFEAPPLEDANLAAWCILLFFTLVQLYNAASSRKHIGTPHRAPLVATLVALVFLAIKYGLGVALTVVQNIVDDSGFQSVSGEALVGLDIVSIGLFNDWVDPAVFAVVVLVLRDRYCTYITSRSTASFMFCEITAALFFVLMFALSTTSGAKYAAFIATEPAPFLSLSYYRNMHNHTMGIVYAYFAIYILATLFLLPFTLVVRKVAEGDRITSLTLRFVVPLLILRAFAGLIILILPPSLDRGYALDLSTTIVYGALYLAVACIFLHFLARPSLWDGKAYTDPKFNVEVVQHRTRSNGDSSSN